jgi:hypothetical protein
MAVDQEAVWSTGIKLHGQRAITRGMAWSGTQHRVAASDFAT